MFISQTLMLNVHIPNVLIQTLISNNSHLKYHKHNCLFKMTITKIAKMTINKQPLILLQKILLTQDIFFDFPTGAQKKTKTKQNETKRKT